MPKFTIEKTVTVSIEVDAPTAQEAFDIQLDKEDWGPDFTLIDCQYEVTDADGNDVSDEVEMG